MHGNYFGIWHFKERQQLFNKEKMLLYNIIYNNYIYTQYDTIYKLYINSLYDVVGTIHLFELFSYIFLCKY